MIARLIGGPVPDDGLHHDIVNLVQREPWPTIRMARVEPDPRSMTQFAMHWVHLPEDAPPWEGREVVYHLQDFEPIGHDDGEPIYAYEDTEPIKG